ncbi:MAG TPA: AbiV family abortive infection protein [Bryobacteraceae bacterium]
MMAQLKEVEPVLEACLKNAEALIASSEAVLGVSGSAHVAYHLAVLSLEEVGKSILLFQETLEPKPLPRHPDDEPRSPLDWLEDHERKLFWSIWLTSTGPLDWRTIPICMDFAKQIHQKRLHSLYFHPNVPDAQQKITTEEVRELLGLATLRLEIERA